MTAERIIVWIVVGALAGNFIGVLVTFRKEGFGRWTNFALGIVGAVVGGFLFNLFNVDLGFAEITITVEDLIAAVVGSFLFVILWWLIRRSRSKKSG